MEINTRTIFYIYITLVFVSVVAFAFIKCKYNINSFDQYLYIEHNENTTPMDWVKFVLTHFIVQFVFGFVFTLDTFYEMFAKTILLEIALVQIKDCSVTQLGDMNSAFLSIIVGMVSFYIGGYVRSLIFPNKSKKQ